MYLYFKDSKWDQCHANVTSMEDLSDSYTEWNIFYGLWQHKQIAKIALKDAHYCELYKLYWRFKYFNWGLNVKNFYYWSKKEKSSVKAQYYIYNKLPIL